MRVLRVLPLILLFCVPLLAQTTPQAQSDPQAIAVVQAAITALGGATAISQAQSWTFQAQLAGPIDTGNRSETIDRKSAAGYVVVNGVTKPAPKHMAYSVFVPALLGAVLLDEFQDPKYGMRYGSTSTLGSEPVTSVTFSMTNSSFAIAQTWVFSSKTNLPVRVQFRLPGHIGQTRSFSGVVDLSDYRPISGSWYPFRIVTWLEDNSPEVITLQSLSSK